MDDKCPYCGLPCCETRPSGSKCYDCGTFGFPEMEERSCECRLAGANQTIARMKPVVDAAMAWHKLSGNSSDLIRAIDEYKESE